MINEFIPYDKIKKRFISPYDVAVNGEGEVYKFIRTEDTDRYLSEVFHIELLEYSGKQDRNGTKLYRGDIVKAELEAIEEDASPAFRYLPAKIIIGVVVIRPSEGAKLLVKKIAPKDAYGIAIGRTIRIKQDQDIRIGNIYTNPELLEE